MVVVVVWLINADVWHHQVCCRRVYSDRLMKLVRVTYKARKLSIDTVQSSGQQCHYSCIQLCDKAGGLLRELLSRADNCYPSTTLSKVSWFTSFFR